MDKYQDIITNSYDHKLQFIYNGLTTGPLNRLQISFTEYKTDHPLIELGFEVSNAILSKYPPGILHFYEHLLFRSNVKYNSNEIFSRFSELDSVVNALTYYKSMAVTCRANSEALLATLIELDNLLFGAFLTDRLTEDEFLKERAIVIEEIIERSAFLYCKAYDTIPRISDLDIVDSIGTIADVKSIDMEMIEKFHKDIHSANDDNVQFFLKVTGDKYSKIVAMFFTHIKDATQTFEVLDFMDPETVVNKMIYFIINNKYYFTIHERQPIEYLISKSKTIITEFEAPQIHKLITDYSKFKLIRPEFFEISDPNYNIRYDEAANRIDMIAVGQPSFEVCKVFIVPSFGLYSNQKLNHWHYLMNGNNTPSISPMIKFLNSAEGLLAKRIREDNALAYGTNVIQFSDYGDYEVFIVNATVSSYENALLTLDLIDEVIRDFPEVMTEEVFEIYSRRAKSSMNMRLEDAISLNSLLLFLTNYGKLRNSYLFDYEYSMNEFKKIFIDNPNNYSLIVGQHLDGSETE